MVIRTTSFKRQRFNLAELEQWKKRTGVSVIFYCRYTRSRVHVTYR